MDILHICDRHAGPDLDLDYNDWLGDLIMDLKPDVVVDNGDGADMYSLNSYDKGTRSFQGASYRKDIEAAVEANDRMWLRSKRSKKKRPFRVTTIGNHEARHHKALELSPELEGTVGIENLQLDDYYQQVVDYDGSTPGVVEIGGIYFAHYLVSGLLGRPISGEHHAYSLISKQNASCVVGHSHTQDYSRRVGIDGRVRIGVVGGCATLHRPKFAGGAVNMWWRGVTYLRNVESGNFDLEWISLDRIEKEYKK
jgi:hypothetical protein